MAYTKKTVESEEVVEKKKKFGLHDMIPCLSITPGEMFFMGERSKDLYTWADVGSFTDVEYQDLKYAVQKGDKMVKRPRFVIQDKDFIAEFPELDKIYGDLYSVGDLKGILSLSAPEMKAQIEALPLGAKDAIKGIAATMIERGQLDSVQRIKVIDEIFGTELLLRLTDS